MVRKFKKVVEYGEMRRPDNRDLLYMYSFMIINFFIVIFGNAQPVELMFLTIIPYIIVMCYEFIITEKKVYWIEVK